MATILDAPKLMVALKAAAEPTRLRILMLLQTGDLSVKDVTRILGQSQPRVSRHLKLMTEAGLVTRHKEGNWVLFRLRDEGAGSALARAIVDLRPGAGPELARDATRLVEVRAKRAGIASKYFRDNAARWEELRSLHVREEDVEQTMLRLAGPAPVRLHVDLGTGTGSVLRYFAPLAVQSLGIDQSLDMLAMARVNLEKAGLGNLQVRHGDIYALPFADAACDFITIHQVLHYLDDPGRALIEAARILQPGGRMLIADFAPHEFEYLRASHAHRRLGIAAEHMAAWLQRAGTKLIRHDVLPPPWRKGETGLTVSLWLAEKPGRLGHTGG
ncbi:MAG: ArsR/SmtB family transcription factor [Aestuariivirga sp.]